MNTATTLRTPSNALISTAKGLLFAHEIAGAIPVDAGAVTTLRTEHGLELTLPGQSSVLVAASSGIQRKECAAVQPGDHLLASIGREIHGNALSLCVDHFEAVTSAKPTFLVEELDEMAARTLGYIVSECNKGRYGGSYILRVAQNASESEVTDDMWKCFSHVFGDSVRAHTANGCIHLSVNRKEVYNWLTEQGVGDGSGAMAIPRIVRMAPLELKCAFLRAYFEGDGSISSGKTSCIKATSKSKILAAQLQLELLNMGIVAVRWSSTVKAFGEYSNVQITSRASVLRFDDLIGFLSPRKRGVQRRANKWDRACLFREVPRAELEFLSSQVTGAEREKIRECLRVNQRVRFGDLRWPIADSAEDLSGMPTYCYLRDNLMHTLKVESVEPKREEVPLFAVPHQGCEFTLVGGLAVPS